MLSHVVIIVIIIYDNLLKIQTWFECKVVKSCCLMSWLTDCQFVYLQTSPWELSPCSISIRISIRISSSNSSSNNNNSSSNNSCSSSTFWVATATATEVSAAATASAEVSAAAAAGAAAVAQQLPTEYFPHQPGPNLVHPTIWAFHNRYVISAISVIRINRSPWVCLVICPCWIILNYTLVFNVLYSAQLFCLHHDSVNCKYHIQWYHNTIELDNRIPPKVTSPEMMS